jgi:two-component system, chemotaxis family, CheB/CheR fusion protein
MLFLGTSETVGEFVDLFATVDRKSKLYQRKAKMPAHAIRGFYRFCGKMDPSRGPPGRRPSKARLPVRELTERACCNSTPRPARLSTNAATSSTSTAAPASTWNRPRARLA